MDALSLNQLPGRTAIINNEEYLFFSGYSYLGMQYVPEFISLIKEGISKYGWLFPSSRISNTRLTLYEECEALLSSITGMEDTILVSSGFIAGKMAIAQWKDKVMNLQPSHPAITACNHSDLIQSPTSIAAVDSVDPIHAAITDFSFIERSYSPETIITDDSHGIGLLGTNGGGISSLLPGYTNTNYVITYSLSKALNVPGGAISCSASLAKELRILPEYTASTAPSPALLHALIKGQHLYAIQREKLKNNILYFQSLIQHSEQHCFHPLLPVVILPSTIKEEELLKHNIIISSFAYPDPTGKKVQRIVLNALHTKDDLEKLAGVLSKVYGNPEKS